MVGTPRFSLPMVCVLGGAMLGVVLFSGRSAESFPDAAPVKWEYNSNVVDATSLQAKFGEMANDGWEVFSMQVVETVLDPAADGKPRLHVDKYMVIGRRPLKP